MDLVHTCGAEDGNPTSYGIFIEHLSSIFRLDDKKSRKHHVNDFISLVSLYGLTLKNCPACLSLL